MSPAAPRADWAIGVDIGGTGIKASLIDPVAGELAFKRRRILTPQPATPEAVVATVSEVVQQVIDKALEQHIIADAAELDHAPIGVAFPGVLKDGVVRFAPNLDQSWIGEHLPEHLEQATGRSCYVLNDADAAGLAEMTFGAGRDYRKQTVILTTLGTGIGTALFANGQLVPFTELGHIEMNGADAETQAAESVRAREGLSFEQWAERLQQYYEQIELLLHPDLILVGGGVSKEHEKFLPLLTLEAPIRPAQLRNAAGIVGAGYSAARAGRTKVKRNTAK